MSEQNFKKEVIEMKGEVDSKSGLAKTNHWKEILPYRKKGSFQAVVGITTSKNGAFASSGCGAHSCDNPGCNGSCSG